MEKSKSLLPSRIYPFPKCKFVPLNYESFVKYNSYLQSLNLPCVDASVFDADDEVVIHRRSEDGRFPTMFPMSLFAFMLDYFSTASFYIKSPSHFSNVPFEEFYAILHPRETSRKLTEIYNNKILIGDLNPIVIGDFVIKKVKRGWSLIRYKNSDKRVVYLPEFITEIGEDCFFNSRTIREVNSFNKNLRIGKRAFGQSSIRKIRTPNGIGALSMHSFYSCRNLEEVYLKETVTAIPISCFEGSGITTINFPRDLRGIREKAFSLCPRLETVILDGLRNLKVIESQAFSYSGIIKLELNNLMSLLNIGNAAFYMCDKIESIKITNLKNLTSIERHAFLHCEFAKQAYLDNLPNLERIGVGAFSCSGVTSVLFYNTPKLRIIESFAFAKCYDLKTIVLPKSLETLENAVFDSCLNLRKLDLSETKISEIGEACFSVSMIKDIILPRYKDTGHIKVDPNYMRGSTAHITNDESIKII